MEWAATVSELLVKKIELLDELSEHASRFPEAAARLDLPSLFSCLQSQEAILTKVQELDEKILRTCPSLVERGVPASTGAISGGLGDVLRAKGDAEDCARLDSLREKAARLQRLNEANRRMIAHSLQHVNGELGILLSFSQNQTGYGEDGTTHNPIPPVSVNRQA